MGIQKLECRPLDKYIKRDVYSPPSSFTTTNPYYIRLRINMRFSLTTLTIVALTATATASKIFGDDTIVNRVDDYRDNYEIPEDNLLPDECESWVSHCEE